MLSCRRMEAIQGILGLLTQRKKEKQLGAMKENVRADMQGLVNLRSVSKADIAQVCYTGRGCQMKGEAIKRH